MTVLFGKSILGYDVYKERVDRPHEFLGFLDSFSLRDLRSTAEKLVLSSHIGQLHKSDTGWLYSTSIGVYLHFELVRRSIKTVSDEFELHKRKGRY